ncbi:MAG: Ig-like domain-containing protein, partial [Alcaligenaceae bacterium]|nr:Ig-like domain-containing protein [Alcaligenaceae bacterium]
DGSTVTATSEDPAGNKSEPATVVAGDSTAPGVPTVTIPEAADGVNAEELADGVQVNVTVPEGTEPGDTITLTVTNPDGTTTTVEHIVTPEDITAGSTTVTIPKDQIPGDGDYTVVAEITDPAGNTSGPSAEVPFTVDAVVPGDSDGDGVADAAGQPVVVIADGDDGVINPADVDADGKVDATITFPADAGYSVGDTVLIKDQAGTELVNRPLTQEDLINGITVKVTPAAEGETTVVTAVVTDPQNNASLEGKDESVTDLLVPGDSDGDGVADAAGQPV